MPQVYTIRDIDNGIEFRSSAGSSYTAHFDGKETPTGGASGGSVVLTKIDDRTIRTVMKRRGGRRPQIDGWRGSFQSITVYEKQ